MPFSIEEHHVLAFAEDVMAAFQQAGSRLRECVDVRTGVVGKSKSFNRIDIVEAATKGSRAETHSHQNPDHFVRWADLVYRYNAILLDPDDDDRVLANPKNRYVETISNSLGRAFDSDVVNAAIGSARSGADRTGSVALPAAQIIAAGGTGLTIAKLRSAKQILDAAEAPDSDRYLAMNAAALEDLLATTEVTSSDFNTVKALVNGQLNTFLGFSFKRLEKITTTTGCVAWHKSAMGAGISRDRNIRIAQRNDMHDAWEAYGGFDFGAVRVEDEGVVQINFV